MKMEVNFGIDFFERSGLMGYKTSTTESVKRKLRERSNNELRKYKIDENDKGIVIESSDVKFIIDFLRTLSVNNVPMYMKNPENGTVYKFTNKDIKVKLNIFIDRNNLSVWKSK